MTTNKKPSGKITARELDLIERYLDDDLSQAEKIEVAEKLKDKNSVFYQEYELSLEINQAISENDIVALHKQLDGIHQKFFSKKKKSKSAKIRRKI